jgi:hypothetical protein
MTGNNFKKFFEQYLQPHEPLIRDCFWSRTQIHIHFTPNATIIIASKISDDLYHYFNVFVMFYYDDYFYLRQKESMETTFKQYWEWRQRQPLKIS